MLKIVEIIGEDSLENLDPETIYFVTKILNKLELTKIRNQILIKTIPKSDRLSGISSKIK